MKTSFSPPSRLVSRSRSSHLSPERSWPMAAWVLLAAGWFAPPLLQAYPPAPHHLIQGQVRDEYGTPINHEATQVILETSAGVQIRTTVLADLGPGLNYRLEVPMDSGLRGRMYKPTALRPTAPFRLKVKIGSVTYLPIEMRGDMAQLGEPGKRTQLNLTLGEDTDGDGLPDAWERLINQDISQVGPETDADGDGLSNLDEYIAGTYAFDPADGFRLDLVRLQDGRPVLQFMALTGRTYRLEGSTDLQTWQPLVFAVRAEGGVSPSLESYLARDVRRLEIEVPIDPTPPAAAHFRLVVH